MRGFGQHDAWCGDCLLAKDPPDTDQIVSLIGGGQDHFWATLTADRDLAVGMAGTHLRTGHDVVMPQLATRKAEVQGFEARPRGLVRRIARSCCSRVSSRLRSVHWPVGRW